MNKLYWVCGLALGTIACGGAAKQTEASAEISVDTDNDNSAAAAGDDVADIQFYTAKDPAVDVSAFHTYAWVSMEGALRDPNGEWSAPDMNVAKEIAFLVDRELRARGMTEVKENPDVLVAYAVVVDMEAQKLLQDKDNNMNIVATVPQNALFVAFVDPTSGEAVWVGAASGEVQPNPSVDLVKKRLDYAVTKIVSAAGR